MAMLSAQAANLDKGGIDGDAVRDALSLLQEASNPVMTSNSLLAASGIKGMSAISTISSSTPSNSIQPRVILTGREGRDLFDYIDYWKTLSPDSGVTWDPNVNPNPAKLCADDTARNKEKWSIKMANHLEDGVHYALPICAEIISSLSSNEGDNIKRKLDILVDANYETEEHLKDAQYVVALRIAIPNLEKFIAKMAQSVTLVEDIVSALLTFKTDTARSRDELVAALVSHSPWIGMMYVPKMEGAMEAASTLMDFFLYQAGSYDKVAIYLKVIRTGAGMVSSKNRRTFITDGLKGAGTKLRELCEDAERLGQALSEAHDQEKQRGLLTL